MLPPPSETCASARVTDHVRQDVPAIIHVVRFHRWNTGELELNFELWAECMGMRL